MESNLLCNACNIFELLMVLLWMTVLCSETLTFCCLYGLSRMGKRLFLWMGTSFYYGFPWWVVGAGVDDVHEVCFML